MKTSAHLKRWLSGCLTAATSLGLLGAACAPQEPEQDSTPTLMTSRASVAYTAPCSADLARGKPVTSSGWWSTATPELAVDGNTSTQWLTNASTGAWMQVDLQQPRSLERAVLTWGWDFNYGASADSVVEASADGSTWTQLFISTRYAATCNGSGGTLCYTPEYRTFSPTVARYVRFRGTRWNYGWGHLNDFEFYGSCGYPISCKDLHDRAPTAPSGVYTLDPDGSGQGQPFEAFCDMSSDGGGWTLAMKLNGAQSTFGFDSALWTNSDTYQAGSPDLDQTEAKLASFSSVAFNEVRLGMEVGGTKRWLKASVGTPAASLLSVLQSGGTVPLVTSTDVATRRELWKGLIPGSSLQPNCNLEALNSIGGPHYVIARIGIITNQEGDCASPDSATGFGLRSIGSVAVPTTGNAAGWGGDNGDTYLPAFGYVFVR